MLKPTDEMMQAFGRVWREKYQYGSSTQADTMRAGLAAALAIVERDYAIGPRACCEPAPGEPMAYCELAEGHKGTHSATVEKAVSW